MHWYISTRWAHIFTHSIHKHIPLLLSKLYMHVCCCDVCTDGVLQHYHDSYATYRRVVATFVLGVEAYHQEKYI